jgi:Response regulators consisting of a CheY-like receiver domain and a winged-helix DNA-binding domain
MSKKILIIEDERSIQNVIKAFLEDDGYCVLVASDGIEGIALFHLHKPDLVLLDLMLPKIDGFTVCELLRKESNTPIIMLTALDDEVSQIKGFDKLVDDYITKPFSMPLVLKRIKALLRRSENNCTENMLVLQYKDITLNIDSYEVCVAGQVVALTAREFEILHLFIENQGRVYTRDTLLNVVWNYEFVGDEKIVNTHIKNIRKKLGVDYIKTIRGVGYRLE